MSQHRAVNCEPSLKQLVRTGNNSFGTKNKENFTPNNGPDKRSVSWTIDQSELQAVILLLVPGPSQLFREIHREGGEAEVQCDSPLPGLRVLVEGGRGRGAAESPGQRRLPAVDMSEHPDVKIEGFNVIFGRVRHSESRAKFHLSLVVH